MSPPAYAEKLICVNTPSPGEMVPPEKDMPKTIFVFEFEFTRSIDPAAVPPEAPNSEKPERALELMCKRSEERVAFGKKISSLGANYDYIAESRIDIETSRLLTLNAANLMDTVGNKVARSEIAQIKVHVPIVACRLIDRAIQMHGGGGVSQDFPLASMYAHMRTLRIADGPDEVHRRTVAREELGKYGGGQSSEVVVTRD